MSVPSGRLSSLPHISAVLEVGQPDDSLKDDNILLINTKLFDPLFSSPAVRAVRLGEHRNLVVGNRRLERPQHRAAHNANRGTHLDLVLGGHL
jgi:hypothetical protein